MLLSKRKIDEMFMKTERGEIGSHRIKLKRIMKVAKPTTNKTTTLYAYALQKNIYI